MGGTFQRIYDGYGRLLSACGFIAGLFTFAMMFLIVANALMRKAFNHPLEGTLEITQAMLPVMVFLSLAYTQLHRGHIRVVLLTRHFPFRIQHGLYVLVLLIGAGFFAWAATATWHFAYESFTVRETAWGAIRFPIYPVKFVIVVGVALLCVQFVLDAVREVLVVRGEARALEEPDVAETEI